MTQPQPQPQPQPLRPKRNRPSRAWQQVMDVVRKTAKEYQGKCAREMVRVMNLRLAALKNDNPPQD